ncbi:flavin reductase family protein [Inquilinus limosus]|uniref:flavin reductase family protein n=1 Tax=Inquilinus limosus TaxID=171674 RepID=UPI00068C4B85|nr:flavin reductase family protein [Inquilinus limosus]
MVARTSLRYNPDPRHPPAVPRDRFVEALTRLTATICVVGATEPDGTRHGRTATAVMSLAADPPTMLVSIDRTSAMAGVIEATEGFSVAMLAEHQDEVADAFAGKLPIARSERFTRGSWSAWPSGRPKLDGAVAVVDCHLIGLTEVSTHILFVGLVTEVETRDASPLLWSLRRYAGVAARPAPTPGVDED